MKHAKTIIKYIAAMVVSLFPALVFLRYSAEPGYDVGYTLIPLIIAFFLVYRKEDFEDEPETKR